MSDRSERRAAGRRALGAGVLAGIAGVVAEVGFLFLAAVVNGKPVLLPLRPLGATFRGEDAVVAGTGSLLYGILLLLVVSALLGALFSAVLPADFEPGGASLLGVGYALFAMSLITAGILPDANPLLRSRMPSLGGSWVIAFSIWGGVLGFLVVRLRRGAGGDRPAPA